MDDFLSIGELAKRSGVAVSAIRFYESMGLIHALRNAGNHRRFPRSELRRVAVIRVAQRAGVPLGEIREALSALPSSRTVSAKDWVRLSRRWKSDLEQRIAQLTALRDRLGDCIGCGCLSLDACPMRNPGDVLARKGPGPQLIPSGNVPRGSDAHAAIAISSPECEPDTERCEGRPRRG